MRSLLVLALIPVAFSLAVGTSDGALPGSTGDISDVDLLKEIENGTGLFQDITIDGLDISSKSIKQGLTFIDVTFTGYVTLMNVTIQEPIIFSNATFKKTARFSDSKFNKSVRFQESNFTEDAYFSNTIFEGIVNFSDTNFSSKANFKRSNFNGGAVFNAETNFIDEADFEDSTFRTADFTGTRFLAKSIFNNTIFNEDAIFRRANFSEAYFFNSTFGRGAQFDKANFSDKACFERSSFGTADFTGANFTAARSRGEVAFNRSKFLEDACFRRANFSEANFIESAFVKDAQFSEARFIGKAIFEECNFTRDAIFENATFSQDHSLFLKGAKFQTFQIRYGGIKDRLAYDYAAYRSLIENYRALGWHSDAADLTIEFVRYLRGHEPGPLHLYEVYYILSEKFYGHGLKPELPLIWSTIIIIIYTIIWISVDRRKRIWIGQFRGRRLSESEFQRLPWLIWDAFCFSFVLFLSGTKLLVDPPEYIEPKKVPGWASRSLFISERVLGLVFFTLFVLSASNIKI